MIVYDLACGQGHVFEGWFRDSATFEVQKKDHDIVCPVCADSTVSKAPMAPNLSSGAPASTSEAEAAPETVAAAPAPKKWKRNRRGREQVYAPVGHTAPARVEALAAEAARVLRALNEEVRKHCDYVGDKFADEARKMHYGESKQRSIYGETTLDEARELRDEGIEVQPLPRLPRENA